mmetsp:Transcript_14820/g.24725  ORF Transcript_14820/g.24725 Transcript_14820/m.24725 type:complete len:621 (+) Transcript_14820:79-1941(+)
MRALILGITMLRVPATFGRRLNLAPLLREPWLPTRSHSSSRHNVKLSETTVVAPEKSQHGKAGPEPPAHFIRNIIKRDLSSGKHKSIITRFPPEPNGYLHLGHAKSICINFGLADEFDGQTFMRFDDTNPDKEEREYIEAILKDVQWLGFTWEDRLTHASDYFDKFHSFAIQLIDAGQAYVDSLSPEELREYRGTLKSPGKNSPYRDRPIAENQELFAAMTNGEMEDGSAVLRLKINMSSPNMNMRDPAIYRIKRSSEHPQTGTHWKVYPMYDYAHCLTDALEGITHSLCTTEFEAHRPLYDWILEQLPVPCRPRQIEFSRLNLQYTVLSKRKLIALVKEGHVNGWDDPRMPTLCGLRRRGFPAEALRLFVERMGVSKAESNIDYTLLEDCVREKLDFTAPRAIAVLDPLLVTITTWPEDEVEMLPGAVHPKRPELGDRQLPFSRRLLIERSDFEEDPPKKFFRLKPGGEVRLRFGYVIQCDEVIKDESGKVVELRCSHVPGTSGGRPLPSGKKVKGIIHWLSESHSSRATVRLYDRLFLAPQPGAEHEDGDFRHDLNPNSLEQRTNCFVEMGAVGESGSAFQFERNGYFCIDQDSSKANVVFNRIVMLRDSWAKVARNG